jgi:hypothetical protein
MMRRGERRTPAYLRRSFADCLGAGFVALEKLNLPLGRLPGDVTWRGKHTTFVFPVVTCLLLSLLGSLALWIIARFR